ncbi:MAG TPA: hypothetical protein VFP50_02865, partial [Anaeromyxobacteraceae bacterium]|nr:hypothetical protein [Anaeromyxobacteraceae bacterium]
MRLLAPIVASALVALLVPGAAAADPFPGRRGASGILDVPDAETIGRGGGLVGGELRLDKLSGVTAEAGPLPLSIVTGLSQRLDVGFFMREWGYPGDPRPSPLLMGAALKLQLFAPELFRPGLALELTSDRFNWKGNGGAQLTSSTGQLGPVRLAAFVGVDGHGPRPYSTALTAGLGATVAIVPRLDTALEAVKTADGPIVGAALRYRLTPRAGVSLGVSWLPDQSGVRVSLGFGAVAVSPAPKPTRVPVAEAPVEEAPAAEEAPAGPLLVEDRPHFRLKIHLSDPSALGEPRHLQHAPYAPPALSAAPPRLPGPTKAAAPSADDVLEAQVKDQETQAEARLKRLRASDEALGDRDAAAQAEARRLEAQA